MIPFFLGWAEPLPPPPHTHKVFSFHSQASPSTLSQLILSTQPTAHIILTWLTQLTFSTRFTQFIIHSTRSTHPTHPTHPTHLTHPLPTPYSPYSPDLLYSPNSFNSPFILSQLIVSTQPAALTLYRVSKKKLYLYLMKLELKPDARL